MHPRKAIRAAVVARLTNATAAGQRVESTRVEPIKGAQLPLVAAYTPSEDTDPDDSQSAPRELWRDLVVRIAAWVQAGTAPALADAMDDIAEQIEAAMDVDRYFGEVHDLNNDSILTTTEMEVVDDGDPLVGQVTLTYQFSYRTTPFKQSDLVDYLRTHATTQIAGAGADNTVSDQFNQRP